VVSHPGWPLLAGLLVAAAVALSPTTGADRLRAIRRTARAGPRWGRRAQPAGVPGPAELALLAEQLAALARAGLPPNRVWPVLAGRAATTSTRALAAAVTAGHRRGESTGEAIRRQQRAAADSRVRRGRGRRPDPAVARLAVAIDVSERTGAGLADTLQRFAEGLRADLHAEQERAAALAGPRSTALILSWLPVAGLALGGLVGANPWRTLVATGPGRAALLAGAVTWLAGRGWSAALVRRAGPG
jgi:tight adherence protein B